MPRLKKISLLLICLCTLLQASAQYYTNQNKVWTFGIGAGLDFTSGAPVPFSSGISTSEGCASVCNAAGSVLFYTNGRTVYNRLGLVMPGGAAIVPFGTWSSTQGALIVPFINDSTKYYVFSVEEYAGSGRLMYAIVDMTLAGGLGDILPGSSGTMINTGMSEKMIAVAGNSCNIWLMTHKRDSTRFYAYEISFAGISSSPVISNVGSFVGPYCSAIGVIKCSPDRQKIVSASYQLGSMWGVELYDFDPTTGIVSNCRVLESASTAGFNYGAEFSPDNTKLYTTRDSIYQWDISLPGTASIVASKTALGIVAGFAADVKLGPDGKIYVSRLDANFIDRINFPNVPGSGCAYMPADVIVYPNVAKYGLPNVVWNTKSVFGPSLLCTGMTATLTASSTGGTWVSSNTSVAMIDTFTGVVIGVSPGTAFISYLTGSISCSGVTQITVIAATTAVSTSLCIGNTTTLSASPGGGSWSTTGTGIATVGSATGIVTGIAAGTTTITYLSPTICGDAIAVVTVNPTPGIIAENFEMCQGDSILLTCSPVGGLWLSGSGSIATDSFSGMVTAVAAGTATVSYMMPTGCFSSVSITVNPTPAPIVGLTTVSVGGSRLLTNAAPGGTWSSGDTTKAKVNATGKVTGIALGTATIYYTLPTGCKVSVVVNVVQNTSVITIGTSIKPTLYPNPASSEITIHAELSTITSFAIYNALGQEVLKSELTTPEIKVDVKALPPGQYQVIFKGDGIREMLRFVKW